MAKIFLKNYRTLLSEGMSDVPAYYIQLMHSHWKSVQKMLCLSQGITIYRPTTVICYSHVTWIVINWLRTTAPSLFSLLWWENRELNETGKYPVPIKLFPQVWLASLSSDCRWMILVFTMMAAKLGFPILPLFSHDAIAHLSLHLSFYLS